VVLGTISAIGLRRIKGRWHSLLIGLFLAPMIVPVIVTAVAVYRSALDVGLAGTVLGLGLSHAILALPFVVINVGIALRAVDENWTRAAAGLGAGPWTIFRTMTLPNITPGLVGGAVFSFITSFDEVVVAVFMAGYANKTLPVKIWESIRLEFTPVVAVAATLMILLAMVLFAVAQGLSKSQSIVKKAETPQT
jgi:putative spermidine/putrescine transport system permease protein